VPKEAIEESTGIDKVSASGAPPTTLRERWLLIARVAWVVVALLYVGVFISGIPSEFARLQTPCTDAVSCNLIPHLTVQKVQELMELGLSAEFFAAYFVAIEAAFTTLSAAIGALIFWRRPDDRMALLVSLMLLTLGAAIPIPLFTLDLSLVWTASARALSFVGAASAILFFYVFPDGRFVPRWSRWLGLASIGVLAPTLLLPYSFLSLWRHPLLNTLLSASIVGALLLAQAYRYKRVSTLAQRQQTKWVVFGTVAALGGYGAFTAVDLLLQNALLASLLGNTAFFVLMLLIPISIAVAVLRYRLYDIDVVINRTLVYGTLTTSVAGIYILAVGGLGLLLKSSGTLLNSLVGTAVVAIVFAPLRDRLQRGVNRLMYGERDDPYAVISRLGERLEAASEPRAMLPTIVETVAQALKLPYAAIALKEKKNPVYEEQSVEHVGEGGFVVVASWGSPLDYPPLRMPLSYGHETIGELILAPRSRGEDFAPADRRLLEDLARQTEVAAYAVRLTDDLQRARERLVSAREEERRRLRRDLHDGLGPQLSGQALTIDAIRSLLKRDPVAAEELLVDLKTQTREAAADIRRLVYALRPPALDSLGLVEALRKRAAQCEQDGSLRVSFEAPKELPPLPAAVEVACYRIAEEALTNVVRHAEAQTCALSLAIDEGEMRLEVRDDGRGLPEARAGEAGRAGVGLTTMRERAAELGGRLVVEALPEGGTCVRAELPLPRED
jgi:signal transduction histidine kinase